MKEHKRTDYGHPINDCENELISLIIEVREGMERNLEILQEAVKIAKNRRTIK